MGPSDAREATGRAEGNPDPLRVGQLPDEQRGRTHALGGLPPHCPRGGPIHPSARTAGRRIRSRTRPASAGHPAPRHLRPQARGTPLATPDRTRRSRARQRSSRSRVSTSRIASSWEGSATRAGSTPDRVHAPTRTTDWRAISSAEAYPAIVRDHGAQARSSHHLQYREGYCVIGSKLSSRSSS